MKAFISKILAVFMTLISIVLPAEPNNVEFSVHDTTTASTSIVYTCINNTGRRIGRADTVSVEKNVDGQWQETGIDFGRTEIFYYISPGGSSTDSIFFDPDMSGNNRAQYLEAGEYRLTISYSVYGLQAQKGQASTVFTVTQA